MAGTSPPVFTAATMTVVSSLSAGTLYAASMPVSPLRGRRCWAVLVTLLPLGNRDCRAWYMTALMTGPSLSGVVYFTASDFCSGPDMTWANSGFPRVVIPAETYWRVAKPYVDRMLWVSVS